MIRLELEPEATSARVDVPLARARARGAARPATDAEAADRAGDAAREGPRQSHPDVDDDHAGRQRPPDAVVADRIRRSAAPARARLPERASGRRRRAPGVDGVFVKQVRVALNSRDPLVTRVVMEISPSAAYHVERTGPDGRDLAVVFEGRKAGSAIMVAPPTAAPRAPGTRTTRSTIYAGAGDRQRRVDHAQGSDDGAARRPRRRGGGRASRAAVSPRRRRCAAARPRRRRADPAAGRSRRQPPQPPPPRAARAAADVQRGGPGSGPEAVHRAPDQLRLRGRRPARRAARVRRTRAG